MIKILKNTFYVFLSKFIDPLLSLFLVVTIARVLGAEGFGEYAFIKATFSIFLVMSCLGLDQLIIREVARDKSSAAQYIVNFGVLNTGFAVIMAAVMCAFVYFSGYPQHVTSGVFIMSGALVASSVSNISRSAIAAFEKFRLNTILISGENIIRVFLGSCILILGGGLIELVLVITITRFFGGLAGLWMVHKNIVPLRGKIDLSLLKRSIRAVPTFSLISIFSILYWRIDVIMLSKLNGMIEVGIYSSAFRIMEIMKAIPLSLKQSVFPVKARMFGDEAGDMISISQKTIKYLAIVLLPLAAGVTVMAEQIIALIYGGGFENAVLALRILVWTIVPYGFAMMLANILVASDHQRIDLWCNISGLLINVALNSILIPRYGVIGASAATLISIFFFITFQMQYIKNNLFRFSLWTETAKPAAAAAILGTVVYPLRHNSLMLVIPVAVLAYALLIHLLGVLNQAEKKQAADLYSTFRCRISKRIAAENG